VRKHNIILNRSTNFQKLLQTSTCLGCKMSLKIHFLFAFEFNFFPWILGRQYSDSTNTSVRCKNDIRADGTRVTAGNLPVEQPIPYTKVNHVILTVYDTFL
jgi:hypothetical protein